MPVSRAFGLACAMALLSAVRPALAAEAGQEVIVRGTFLPRSPDVFGTVGLPVRAERYSELWQHVASAPLDSPLLQRFVAPARNLDRAAQLAFVQRAVRQIRWRSDATIWGQHEYWATATETLRAGYADDDCLAILKMQALQALGWSPRDLFLTLGHDQVVGATALLLVRTPAGFEILDERADGPMPAAARTGFTPQLSFSAGGAWLHGRRYAGGTGRTSAAR